MQTSVNNAANGWLLFVQGAFWQASNSPKNLHQSNVYVQVIDEVWEHVWVCRLPIL